MLDLESSPPPLAHWVSAAARTHFMSKVVGSTTPDGDIAAIRAHYDAINHERFLTAMRLYPAQIEQSEIGGVPVAIITPADGVTDGRTLMCLHGGAFMWGRGEAAWLEAIPVAVSLGCRVIAVDYRLAPEHVFPAAVDDALACFRALLVSQPPESIGIFGCSAGAVLCAQLIARLIVEGDPVPGAISMLHGAALDLDGDSATLAAYLNGTPSDRPQPSMADLPYLASADPADVLVFPAEHPAMLAKFPPSLSITGTRDLAASTVMTTHRRLLAAGTDAGLVVFDGLWHAHHVDTELPESREVFNLLARFFGDRLKSPI